jgi:PmbA protein
MVSAERVGSLVDIAQTLLRHAAAEGATQAEALVLGTDSALTRFANSEIHQNVAETDLTASLRFVIGRRIGVASSNRLGDDGLRDLADRAGRIARIQHELEDFVSLPEPGPIPDVRGGFSEATATSTPEARAAGAGAVIAAADAAGVLAFGSLSTSLDRLAVANSLGIAAEQATTSAQLITVCMGPDGEAGYAEAVAVDVTGIDVAAIGREAAERARRSRKPVALPPGEYPVVLEPYAVVDLVDMLGYLGFSAAAVQEDRSFFEAGKRIGSDLVSIWDDGTDPAGLPMAFDYEGVGKQRVTLVEHGICREVVYDAQTAAREGRRSTGHGLPAPNPWGPFPQNGFMAAGEASREELIGGLDRGLLVTRFHYTNPVHPKLGIVTGMTRDGTFLVEQGEVVGPVRNLRYTQSYLSALAGVTAVGRERRLLRGFLGSVLVPGLRLEAFEFTGATEH